MSEPTKHTGGCHCGKVRYQVEIDLAQPVIACNCSMCGRSGTLLAFVPAEKFELLQGEDSLKDYKFNKHAIHHLFCTSCGIKSFARGASADDDARIQALVDERAAAKQARDFARADAIRAQLAAEGVQLEDTPQGVRWTRKG